MIMIDLKNNTPKNQRLEVWNGNYQGYDVEVYQKRTPFSYVSKWFYRIKKENFIFDLFSENKHGYQEKVSASGGAYQHINKLLEK